MSVDHAQSRSPHRTIRWAWAFVALTPLGWAAGIGLVFLSGEGQASGTGSIMAGLLGTLVFVAVPAMSVALAVEAHRAHRPSGHAAVLVSGILFALTVFGTMLVGVAAIASIAVALILLIILGLRANRDRR